MKTTFTKDGSSYTINLIVKKINVFYSGLDKFPFCCDVLAEDDYFFRCAVGIDRLAIFLLSECGDELYVSMHAEYKKSAVMAADSCINTTQSWSDLAWNTRYRDGFASRITPKINIKQSWLIPMPFVLSGANTFMQDAYYCLILDDNNQYIECICEGKYVSKIASAPVGDQLELTLEQIESGERWSLQAVQNLSRHVKEIYVELQKL